MNWSSLFISGFLVWIIQLTIADLFTIDTIRPDFIGILIVYWAVKYGRFLGTLSGLIFGIIVLVIILCSVSLGIKHALTNNSANTNTSSIPDITNNSLGKIQ